VESLDALLMMRMVERLLGLLAGGLCVVLGYRLFMNLPDKTDQSGKIVLPGGVSIWLSRVGPGVFFALFGAAIVAYSFASTVRATSEEGPPARTASAPPQAEPVGLRRREIAAMSPHAAAADPAAREKELIELRGTMADLNAIILRLEADAPPAERGRLISGAESAKMLLLRGYWEAGWGDPDRLQAWINSGGAPPAPAGMDVPAALYRNGLR
jgi:hypothetical protein